MSTNYKATAAQARYIAHLVAEKGWEPADLRANYGEHARALGDYGTAYLAGDTFVQIARGMNKKAASKFIDLLLDDSAEWAFPEAPEPEEPEADAEQAEEADAPAEVPEPEAPAIEEADKPEWLRKQEARLARSDDAFELYRKACEACRVAVTLERRYRDDGLHIEDVFTYTGPTGLVARVWASTGNGAVGTREAATYTGPNGRSSTFRIIDNAKTKAFEAVLQQPAK